MMQFAGDCRWLPNISTLHVLSHSRFLFRLHLCPTVVLQAFGLSTCFINVPAQVHLNAICEVLSWHYEARQLMFYFICFTASKAIPPHMMSSLYKLSAISSVSSDFSVYWSSTCFRCSFNALSKKNGHSPRPKMARVKWYKSRPSWNLFLQSSEITKHHDYSLLYISVRRLVSFLL